MKVDGTDYRTVWMEDGVVHMIEQNRLPFEFAIATLPDHEATARAIEEMTVRGAGAIGAAAGYAMAQGFLAAAGDRNRQQQARARILATRPTAQNLFHAVERVWRAGCAGGAEAAVAEAEALADADAEASRRIGLLGDSLIGHDARILTHCNAGWLAFVDHGTALSPIYRAHEKGKRPFVWIDETRPRGQGARLTAWELTRAGIECALIADNAAAHYMAAGMVDLVIVGADRIAANGDTANKIGTLEKAICADRFGIPFYVAAPCATIDPDAPEGSAIPIEERSADELLWQEGVDADGRRHTIRVAAPGVAAHNPAFDVTPAGLIRAIITERGIIPPAEAGAVAGDR
ncbi:MAG: S-methyl-5-thioribose-1-phosphate isomerase [Zetaproteobacteria bacterium]|nr:MAG: S-methyl-5-thioribose-1-phosphate isomerase [Zetaproteobacteria bacterium]